MRAILSTITMLFLFITSGFSQFDTKDPEVFQRQLAEFYMGKKSSPIKDKALRERITGLDYFPIRKKYVVESTFHRTIDGEVRTYEVSSGKPRKLQQYGYVVFQWKGKEHRLNILKEMKVYNSPYDEFVEIPFYDATNNDTTYGGGRYLWFWTDELIDGKPVTLDFNLAFNPYCAYTKGYACIIPPEENRLPFKVKAGVKKDLLLREE